MSIAKAGAVQHALAYLVTSAVLILALAGCNPPAAGPPTLMPVPPASTAILPTNTPIPPTATPVPTSTAVPPINTPIPPTNTYAPTVAQTSAPIAAIRPSGAAVTTTVEPGWTLNRVDTEGYSISLAPKWKRIDVDAQTMDATMATLADQDPSFKSMLTDQARALASKGVKFFAFDLAPEAVGTGFASNVNILRLPLPSKVSLATLAQANVGTIENMDSVIKPVTQQRVQIGDMDAEQVTFGLKIKSGSGDTVQLADTQYYVLVDKDLYVLTFTTTGDQAARYAPIFDKMARSFRLLK